MSNKLPFSTCRVLHHKLLQQKTALFCSQLQQVCCRPATPRRTQVMQRRKTPKPSHLLQADLHGLLLHLQLLKSRSFFCMPWLHPDCICCMVHLGSCCVCILLCVCTWLLSMQGYCVCPSQLCCDISKRSHFCTDKTSPCAFLQQALHRLFCSNIFADIDIQTCYGCRRILAIVMTCRFLHM